MTTGAVTVSQEEVAYAVVVFRFGVVKRGRPAYHHTRTYETEAEARAAAYDDAWLPDPDPWVVSRSSHLSLRRWITATPCARWASSSTSIPTVSRQFCQPIPGTHPANRLKTEPVVDILTDRR